MAQVVQWVDAQDDEHVRWALEQNREEEALDAFEARAIGDPAVQQCYRTASGPDFVLFATVVDMPAWHAFLQRVMTDDAHVRNVKSFFVAKRAKFAPAIPLRRGPDRAPPGA